jgi:5'-deoxynucleotidase
VPRHFFAYMSRMKHIKRWALMRNTWQEDIAQHSLQVAMIAHALALLRNERFGGGADPERAMALAVYHEAPEVITGDLATPIKYFNPGIRTAYKEIEGIAAKKLLTMLPDDLAPRYRPYLMDAEQDPEWRRVKAADKLSAYIKCVEELRAGNEEFRKAGETIRQEIEGIDLPEVRAFTEEFLPSFHLTMDEMD